MRNLIFAFPGMGKTPTCKWIPNCMDLDFGMFRNALDVKKEDETKIFPEFVRLINQYLDEKWHVFTNEPKLCYKVKNINTNSIIMYLPRDEKGYKMCAKKMHVDVPQIIEWVKGWEKCALDNNVQIQYIAAGLDFYFWATISDYVGMVQVPDNAEGQ